MSRNQQSPTGRFWEPWNFQVESKQLRKDDQIKAGSNPTQHTHACVCTEGVQLHEGVSPLRRARPGNSWQGHPFSRCALIRCWRASAPVLQDPDGHPDTSGATAEEGGMQSPGAVEGERSLAVAEVGACRVAACWGEAYPGGALEGGQAEEGAFLRVCQHERACQGLVSRQAHLQQSLFAKHA